MANTYTQLFVQIIFTVKFKERLIYERYRIQLEKYICGIIKNKNSKPFAIYCNPDHTHVLIGIDPSISVSDMAKCIKSNSSLWINEQKWFNDTFKLQEGFGAFSYAKSQIDSVVKYILNQPNHHKSITFRDEYLDLLKKSDIDYNENYLFEWFN